MSREEVAIGVVLVAVIVIAYFKRKRISEGAVASVQIARDAATQAIEAAKEAAQPESPNSNTMNKEVRVLNPTAKHRGMRNNNPGNVEDTQNWRNKVPSFLNTDGRFAQFYEMKYGVRAAAILIRNYMNGRNGSGQKLNSIRKILNRWAPPVGNFQGRSYNQNTEGYITHVSQLTGYGADHELQITRETMFRLLKAIFTHENAGEVPTDAEISAGIELAGIR